MAFSDDKVIFIKRAIFVSADCIGNSDVESIRASAENFFYQYIGSSYKRLCELQTLAP
jgi:hypothetical protein